MAAIAHAGHWAINLLYIASSSSPPASSATNRYEAGASSSARAASRGGARRLTTAQIDGGLGNSTPAVPQPRSAADWASR